MSEFELLAAFIKEDRFFVEVDEYGFGELLTNILRECHDFNHPKWEAPDLALGIAALIGGYVTNGGLAQWEEEGVGPMLLADWQRVDEQSAMDRRRAHDDLSAPEVTVKPDNSDDADGWDPNIPGLLDPITGRYNHDPLEEDERVPTTPAEDLLVNLPSRQSAE